MGEPLSPEYLAEADSAWRDDIDTVLATLKFHRDWYKRPSMMRK